MQKDITDIFQEIATLRASGQFRTYEAIGERLGISKALVWKMHNEQHEPVDAHIRATLGLTSTVAIIPVNGNVIPAGTQAHSAKQCECGKWFVPNHPRRGKCFRCSPFRGRTPLDAGE